MTQRLRRLALTAHLATSISWMGAVGAFLALALAGLSSQDPQVARAAYLGMNLTTWFVILPLAAASLVSGLICSLGTALGLFRYYWVVMKLSISLFSSMVLVIHLQPIERLAVAAHGGALGSNLHQAQLMMVVASAVAVAVFALLTALSVYRPRGLTPYGARRSGP